MHRFSVRLHSCFVFLGQRWGATGEPVTLGGELVDMERGVVPNWY